MQPRPNGVEIKQGGDPTLRDRKIHENGGGVVVYEQGRGTVEGSDIFANKRAGVAIKQGGDPTIRDCKIHDSKEGGGVFVYEQGRGTVEGCDIFAKAKKKGDADRLRPLGAGPVKKTVRVPFFLLR